MLRTALVASFALVLAVLLNGMSVAEADAEPNAATPFGIVLDACNYHCRDCTPPGSDKKRHDIVVAQENNHSSSHLENCNVGECSSHNCDEEFPEGEELWFAVLHSEGKELGDVLSTNAHLASINYERQSVQINCSSGTIIANLPLTDAQMESLRALPRPVSESR